MRAAWLVFVVGCTHHRDIREAHQLAGEEVELTGQYGHTVTAVGVRGPNGITFVDKANGGMVPDEEIVTITDVSHGRGALQGLGIGAAAGIATGMVAGFASGDDNCDNEDHGCFFELTAEAKAMIFGVLLGALGGGVGLIVGAVKGSTTIYAREGSNVSVRLGGPASSVAGVTVNF
jgi:hypothetical protein